MAEKNKRVEDGADPQNFSETDGNQFARIWRQGLEAAVARKTLRQIILKPFCRRICSLSHAKLSPQSRSLDEINQDDLSSTAPFLIYLASSNDRANLRLLTLLAGCPRFCEILVAT